ncbi:MAG: phosphatidate cytidylyltransferase [Flavobacteriaceae bacterium]|nr:phosphatidate cytidylyltransferase [Flavobacteriaceae bacterium]
MKELFIRALSGALYAALLLLSLQWQDAVIALFLMFGIISLWEFNRLIKLKGAFSYIIFILLYSCFAYWETIFGTATGFIEAIQIFQLLCTLVLLFLIRDLFTNQKTPSIINKVYISSTFYVTAGFVFIVRIADYFDPFNPNILLGTFLLAWINDTFAYLVGKNFGKRKLFPSISPKKTVEGFLGGLFFSCIGSYFIAQFTETLDYTSWFILSIIINVFGTIGDLVESKYKRQAGVKDSGNIMPGHGGLLDRLDSIIFAAPFIYLFLRLLEYVS